MKNFTQLLRSIFVSVLLLLTKQNFSQCTASFNYSPSVSMNGVANFTSTSITNTSTTVYFWTFGNGIPTYSATGFSGMFPSYTYSAIGNYTVTLFILSSSPSCSSSVTSVITVTNVMPCTLNANFTSSQGSAGLVNFNNTSTGTISSTTYYWTFGDGASSTSVSPAHTYSANGIYIAKLFAANNGTQTCTDSTQFNVIVNSYCSLNVGFSVASTSVSNAIQMINNTTNTTSSTTYFWDFGDGNTSTAFAPAHTYTVNGNYTATLVASNSGSAACSSTATSLINMCGASNYVVGITYSLGPNGQVTINSTGVGTGTAVSCTWNVNGPNGTIQFFTPNPPTFTLANAAYQLVLTAQNGGCMVSASTNFTVTTAPGCALTPNFSANAGFNGLINFNNTSTGTSSITSYSWNFGNGQTSTLQSPSITYTANGNYLVTLYATNNSTPACSGTKTLMVNVNSICPLAASFTYTVGNGGLVTFNNTSTGTSSLTSLQWNFGHSSSGNPGTSTVSAPSHTYPSGYYLVKLTVSNGILCNDTAYNYIYINICGLTGASFSHTVGSSGLVNFTSAYTGTLNSPTYSWNFGDGWTSNAANPNHTYSNGGTHYVNLIISDTGNVSCADTITQAINITGIACTANPNFTLVPTSTPQFWNAIPAYPYNVIAAQWNWGDGSSSNTLYTSHQYSASANYSICLTVTVSCGASASACASYFVYKSAGQTSGIVNVNVQAPGAQVETGISETANELVDFKIYPNPNQGSFKLTLNDSPNETIQINIYTILGEKIYSDTIEAAGSPEKEIKLPAVTSGIYFLKLESLNKTSTQKVIVNK